MKNILYPWALVLWLITGSSVVDAQAQVSAVPSRVIDTIRVGNYPLGIAFNPRNGYLYVANVSDDTVSIIDGTTNTAVDAIRVGSSPRGVTYDPRTGNMYVWRHFPIRCQ
jgi:YVTN family beta-propeller protein